MWLKPALVLLVLSILLSMGAAIAFTPPYYNSGESICNPSDSNVLFCEDFETKNPKAAPCDKRWGQYADSLVPPSDFDGCAKGWGMKFTCPSQYPECVESGGVTPFGTYAGNMTPGPGSGGDGADHMFAPNRQTVQDVYFRWYQKWKSPGLIGAEKIFQPMYDAPNGAGIDFGDMHTVCGGASASSQGLQWQPVPPEPDACLNLNFTITTNRWYAFGLRIKMSSNSSTANGILQFWADDCGTAGTACTGTPTLRFSRTTMRFPVSGSLPGVRAGWWNGFANPATTSERVIDNIMVMKTGPIPFSGAAGPDLTPPAAPTGITITKAGEYGQ